MENKAINENWPPVTLTPSAVWIYQKIQILGYYRTFDFELITNSEKYSGELN
jgi:hypothetical protein